MAPRFSACTRTSGERGSPYERDRSRRNGGGAAGVWGRSTWGAATRGHDSSRRLVHVAGVEAAPGGSRSRSGSGSGRDRIVIVITITVRIGGQIVSMITI